MMMLTRYRHERDHIYFNQIPKTAGTSVRAALERLFPSHAHNNSWFVDDLLYEPELKLRTYRLLCGHFAMVPHDLISGHFQTITFLRNPVDRAYSHYLHLKTVTDWPYAYIVQTLGFEDFLYSPVAEGELLNLQTRYLLNNGLKRYLECKDRIYDRNFVVKYFRRSSLLSEAKENLAKCWFIGSADNFIASMDRLGAQLGVSLDTETRLNVSNKKELLPELSQSARARLDWLTEFDQELIHWLESQGMIAEGPDKSELVPSTAFYRDYIDFKSGFVGGGWYPVEHRDGTSYCWSMTRHPWVEFFVSDELPKLLTARLATYVPEDIERLTLVVNSQIIPFDLSNAARHGEANFKYLCAAIPAGIADRSRLLRVEFHLPRTITPYDFGHSDRRSLGVYVNWIRISPQI